MAFAQRATPTSAEGYVSVLTILPGEALHSAFGHTAIRVREDSMGIDAVYNFGTFDFDTEWFYVKFARGLLDYRLARNRFEDVLTAYTAARRPIIEQRLGLDENERQALILRLEHNYLPQNRFYRYDFFFDNCSTRPRDVIESAIGHRTLGGESITGDTFRELISPYTESRPWVHFGIDVLLGSRTDRHATARERLFLPDELMASLDTASVNGSPVVVQTDTIFWPRGYERSQNSPLVGPSLVAVLLLLFGIAAAATRLGEHPALRHFDAALFLFGGLTGLVILFLWFGTEHTVTRGNWNILWALPTHLPAAVAVFQHRTGVIIRSYFWFAGLSAGLVLLAWIAEIQEFHLAVLPLSLLMIVRAADRVREHLPQII